MISFGDSEKLLWSIALNFSTGHFETLSSDFPVLPEKLFGLLLVSSGSVERFFNGSSLQSNKQIIPRSGLLRYFSKAPIRSFFAPPKLALLFADAITKFSAKGLSLMKSYIPLAKLRSLLYNKT